MLWIWKIFNVYTNVRWCFLWLNYIAYFRHVPVVYHNCQKEKWKYFWVPDFFVEPDIGMPQQDANRYFKQLINGVVSTILTTGTYVSQIVYQKHSTLLGFSP